MTKLQEAIQHAINCVSAENGSDTPDFILTRYLTDCLAAYDRALVAREKWYGRECGGFKGLIPVDGPPPPDSENAQSNSPAGGEIPQPETHQSEPAASETSTESGLCAPPCSAPDLYAAWDILNQVFDFRNRPTILGYLAWYISKINNQLSPHSLSSFLIYLPEIEMAIEKTGLSWSELQNHHYQLARSLRSHANTDLMVGVRRQLDNTFLQPLLLISRSSPDTDLYIASLKTSVDTLQRYVADCRVHIPSDPIHGGLEMDIDLKGAVPLVSKQAQGPFENTSPPVVEGVHLEFREVSFGQNVHFDLEEYRKNKQ